MRRAFLFLCILSSFAACAYGQQKNDYTLNLGFNYGDRARKQPTFSDKETVPGKFEYWVFDNLSVRVQSSLLVSKNSVAKVRSSGRGDAFLGANFTLVDFDPTHPLGISFDYQVKIPTAIKGLGTDKVDHQITATLYRNFAQNRVYAEFDGGTYIAGQQGRTDIAAPQFSIIETVGLGKLPAEGTSYKWKLLNETDYSPAATGSPSSIVETVLIINTISPRWNFKFGPNFAITPYDSRFGFSAGIQFKGHFGK